MSVSQARTTLFLPGFGAGALREPGARRGDRVHSWWESRLVLVLAIAASVLPLLWPDIPPLADLPGHMGRYRVQMEIGQSEALSSFYGFEWALIGNLGVDLLVIPLAPLFGLEAAVKLIVTLTGAGTAAGLLWTAHEVHGRIPPTAFLALPLAYGFPLIFGFVNFALSMALALLAFAWWLRLSRQGRTRTRAAAFLLISPLLWVAHAYGWAVLCVLAFSAEFVRQATLVRPARALLATAVQCLPLLPPALLMLAWRSGDGVAGASETWFYWSQKADWLLMVLRDRWKWFDIASALTLFGVAGAALLARRRLGYAPSLLLAASLLGLLFLLLPRTLLGSNFADMRLAPFGLAVALIGIRPPALSTRRLGSALAIGALIFLSARSVGTAASFYLADREFDRELAALPHVPEHARLLSLVGVGCFSGWHLERKIHLPAMALVRRGAFSNDQWALGGAQLLSVRKTDAGRFRSDPSQIVRDPSCTGPGSLSLDQALRTFPRGAFDHVWLIAPGDYDPKLVSGWTEVWRDGRSVLFRLPRA